MEGVQSGDGLFKLTALISIWAKNMNKVKTIFRIMTPRDRKRAIVLLLLMLIGMILEVMGVGLVLPALVIMAQINLAEKYPILIPLLNDFGNPDQATMVVFGMFLLVSVYFVKAIFLTYLSIIQNGFVFDVQASLSARLFSGYMSVSYEQHLSNNSANMIRNIINEAAHFQTCISAMAIVITELLVIGGVVMLLLMIEPESVLIAMFVLYIINYLFYRKTRVRILDWGNKRQSFEGRRIQYLQQGLNSLKIIKMLGKENNFVRQYMLPNSGAAEMSRKMSIMITLPRLWLEFLAVVFIVVLVIIKVQQKESFELMLPTVGLFAAAAFRLMPSAYRIVSNFQILRYSLPVTELLEHELNAFEQTKISVSDEANSKLIFKKEISLENISFSYKGSKTTTINDARINIKRGTSVGFVGESGSGKSTLIDITLGLLKPDKGVVLVDGIDIQNNLRSWQSNVGYVPQHISLSDDTLRRNVAFGIDDKDIDDVAFARAIEYAQLTNFVSSLKNKGETKVGENGEKISGGQRQRIGIARALYHNPMILVLDEATSALDIKTEAEFMQVIYDLNGTVTVLIISHKESIISNCDQILKLSDGKIERINNKEDTVSS